MTSNTLMSGTTVRTMPVQEVVVAIEPGEVALLEEAVGMKYDITCAAQFGPAVAGRAPARPNPSTPTGRRVSIRWPRRGVWSSWSARSGSIWFSLRLAAVRWRRRKTVR